MRDVAGDKGARPSRKRLGGMTRGALRAAALRIMVAGMAAAMAGGVVHPTPARAAEGGALTARKAIAAPDGFGDVCSRYEWACAAGRKDRVDGNDLMALARGINRAINTRYRQITDRSQYGAEEVWSLPTASRGGDCEDFVLAKKQSLIAAGVAPGRLLIATVLDRRRALHAVLVLRTDAGDFVLDNLNNSVKSWQETGYSFLRMQNPEAPHRWNAVFAGGVFNRASS